MVGMAAEVCQPSVAEPGRCWTWPRCPQASLHLRRNALRRHGLAAARTAAALHGRERRCTVLCWLC